MTERPIVLSVSPQFAEDLWAILQRAAADILGLSVYDLEGKSRLDLLRMIQACNTGPDAKAWDIVACFAHNIREIARERVP